MVMTKKKKIKSAPTAKDEKHSIYATFFDIVIDIIL